MSLNEIKIEKTRLENQILYLIQLFEQSHKVTVTNIKAIKSKEMNIDLGITSIELKIEI